MRAVDLLVLLDRSEVDLRLFGGRVQVRGEIPADLASAFNELRPQVVELLRARSDLPDDPDLDVESRRQKASRYSMAEVQAGLRLMAPEELGVYRAILEDYRADVPGYPTFGEELSSRLAYAITRAYWRREGSRLFQQQLQEHPRDDPL